MDLSFWSDRSVRSPLLTPPEPLLEPPPPPEPLLEPPPPPPEPLLEPPPPEVQQLFAAVHGNRKAMDAFVRIVDRTLDPDPDKRYDSSDALGSELASLIAARVDEHSAAVIGVVRRRWGYIAIGVGVVLAIVLQWREPRRWVRRLGWIAALGVISARTVVERRQQIGVLRAIGFQKRMVEFSFLLESSFVAVLGIGLGLLLGLIMSYNVIAEIQRDWGIEGLTFGVPWLIHFVRMSSDRLPRANRIPPSWAASPGLRRGDGRLTRDIRLGRLDRVRLGKAAEGLLMGPEALVRLTQGPERLPTLWVDG